jgi:inner membrane protein
VSRPDKEPGGFIWLVGLIDLTLPWVGAPLAIVGLVMGVRGYANGWWLFGAGATLLVADFLLTIFWARPASRQTDQPLLNLRGAQCVGRVVEVVTPIRFGEGKVRVAGSVWSAHGPDCEAGTWVKVIAADTNRLTVEPAPSLPGDRAPPDP